MIMVLQRAGSSHVQVGADTVGSIESGLVVLLGVAKGDTRKDADYLVEKALSLRIFPDETGKMNKNIQQAGGSLLVVSQFTLLGDCRKGRRPSFDRAADPQQAKELYEYFVSAARASGIRVETGIFQAFMSLRLTNEGPVTIICESHGNNK